MPRFATIVLLTFAFIFFVSLSFSQRINQGTPADRASGFSLQVSDRLFSLAEEFSKNPAFYDSAIFYYNRAIQIQEQLGAGEKLVERYLALSTLYLQQNRYEACSSVLEKALTVFENVPIPIPLQLRVYDALSTAKMEMRDMPMALSLTQKWLTLISKHDRGNSISKSRAYKRIGNIYFYSKRYDDAIRFLQFAIREAGSDNFRELGRLYSDLAMVYEFKKEYERAVQFYNRAIKYDQRWSGKDSDPVARRYLQKAFAFLSLGKKDSTYVLLLKNRVIRKKVFGAKHVNSFGAELSLGQYFQQIGKPDSAARYYQASLISLIRHFHNSDLAINPKPNPEEINTDLILGLVCKANALKEIAERDNFNVRIFTLALKTYLLADSAFFVYRNNFLSDDPQLSHLSEQYIPYDNAVQISLSLYKQTHQKTFVQTAINLMERSRGVVLQRSLSRAEAYNKAGVDANIKIQENNFLRSRREIIQNLNSTQDETERQLLYNRLLEVTRMHQDLIREVEQSNAEYVNIKYRNPRVEIDHVIRRLRGEDAILVEYLWGKDSIYAISVSGNGGIKTKVISNASDFNSAFQNVLMELSGKHQTIYQQDRFERFSSASHELYKSLIDGLVDISDPSSGINLIICGDGPLTAFPFETLITDLPTSQIVSYRLPYLLHNRSISYVVTVNQWLNLKHALNEKSNVISFAYGESSGMNNAVNLPGTKIEIDQIKSIIGEGDHNYFKDTSATESNFKRFAPNYAIVHLAIHGITDSTNNDESHLIFQAEGQGRNDSRLYARELYDLDLSHLRLVLLSACETGVARHQSGEGMLSMARAFGYAGCPALITSLWKIDDANAADIMRRFYQHSYQGENTGTALWNAKRDFLNDANDLSAHPTFWASFVHIGSNDPVFQRTWAGKLVIASVSVAFMLFIGFFYWLKTRGQRRIP